MRVKLLFKTLQKKCWSVTLHRQPHHPTLKMEKVATMTGWLARLYPSHVLLHRAGVLPHSWEVFQTSTEVKIGKLTYKLQTHYTQNMSRVCTQYACIQRKRTPCSTGYVSWDVQNIMIIFSQQRKNINHQNFFLLKVLVNQDFREKGVNANTYTQTYLRASSHVYFWHFTQLHSLRQEYLT